MKEEAIAEACPVCCGNCNCKACLRLDGSLKELNNLKLKINEDEKVHHSMYLLHALIPFLKHFNQEQLMEKEIEAKIQGLSLAALELQKAACEKDERVYCNYCKTSVVDFHRSCPNCFYDLCLTCCREVRDGHLQGGRGFFILLHWFLAYNCYVEALCIQPNFAIAWSNLAGLFMEAGDLNRSLQYYKEAVKLKPAFPDAYLNLGSVYKALGMPQEAIVCYQRALQSRPDYAMAYGNFASIYYEQGKLDMAILHYKRAIACDAAFLEAYNNLSNALKDAGRVEEAIPCYHGNYTDSISCYNEVLRIDPLAADRLVNRGNTYKEIGRVNETMAEAHANLASAYKDRLQGCPKGVTPKYNLKPLVPMLFDIKHDIDVEKMLF